MEDSADQLELFDELLAIEGTCWAFTDTRIRQLLHVFSYP